MNWTVNPFAIHPPLHWAAILDRRLDSPAVDEEMRSQMQAVIDCLLQPDLGEMQVYHAKSSAGALWQVFVLADSRQVLGSVRIPG